MTESARPTPATILLYTEEQRGNQWVESIVVGMLSDISGHENEGGDEWG
ncbi:hypothetical protein HDL45_06570 [Bordetella pertussis]|nr:hypothetical protein HDL45_06570 [Bordetella pertussis]